MRECASQCKEYENENENEEKNVSMIESDVQSLTSSGFADEERPTQLAEPQRSKAQTRVHNT